MKLLDASALIAFLRDEPARTEIEALLRQRDAPLSLADCVLLATAQHEAATVVSSDGALLRAARADGIDTAPVRGSAGRRPR